MINCYFEEKINGLVGEKKFPNDSSWIFEPFIYCLIKNKKEKEIDLHSWHQLQPQLSCEFIFI